MTTKTDELEPCPCCGGEAAFNTTRTTCRETIKLNKRDTGYGVNCVVCGINNRGLVLGYESKALAAEAWNRRAALQSQDREDAAFLQEDDQHDLHRFIETTEDGQGYDIGKERIKRLAELGVVSNQGFGRYSVTAFGYWAHERYWHQNPSLPLKTIDEYNAEATENARRRIEGEAKP